ncbi:MAG: bifunctional phosphopantothenoylcysteine decarboxylase/phosphopantothenate--cysteine ligase CoaBC [Flavobacteriaceae bacterium]
MSILKDKNILLGVTGSIAAYKSVYLLRLLKKEGCNVKVLLTKSALDFITPLTFSTLSNNKVYIDFVEEENFEKKWNNHVELAEWADYFIISPATSSTISKLVNGNSDNILLATFLSFSKTVFFAPSMDLEMYKSPSTSANIKTLIERGCICIEPGEGFLASGMQGKGRVEEPENIVEILKNHVRKDLILNKKKILVTAGPTYEMIDSVRFIGNFSSGKMGFAMAEAASKLGADVFLVTGPTQLKTDGTSIKVFNVTSADEMLDQCLKLISQVDICIMNAAVSDYKPAKKFDKKLKKETDLLKEVKLVLNKDILKELSDVKSDKQILVGFALETDNEVNNAKLKLKNKNLDAIVMNSLNDDGSGFDSDTNQVTFITELISKKINLNSKSVVAHEILTEIANL